MEEEEEDKATLHPFTVASAAIPKEWVSKKTLRLLRLNRHQLKSITHCSLLSPPMAESFCSTDYFYQQRMDINALVKKWEKDHEDERDERSRLYRQAIGRFLSAEHAWRKMNMTLTSRESWDELLNKEWPVLDRWWRV